MTQRITLEELTRMLADPDVQDDELKQYLTTERLDADNQSVSEPAKGLGPVLMPNHLVDVQDSGGQGTQANIGMGFLNDMYRERRRKRFERDLVENPAKPILLAEGDSWFEYPVWLKDTIDYLSKHYTIFCLSAAGDELQGMIADAEYRRYLKELVIDRGLDVEGILLSGGGNDIVGKTLYGMLRNYSPQATVDDLINQTAFNRKFADIRGYYNDAIEFINEKYPGIPIFIHSYDYGKPLPEQGFNIPPLDGWLGEWLRERDILDNNPLQQQVVNRLIDSFCESQQLIAQADSVTFIDCRNVVGNQWFDELHPNDDGFKQVAEKFHAALKAARIGAS